jgi:hypothetical protein
LKKDGKDQHATEDETRCLMHGTSDEGTTYEKSYLNGRKRLFVEILFKIKEHTAYKWCDPQVVA